MKRFLLTAKSPEWSRSAGLLVLRLSGGLIMLLGHGWGKTKTLFTDFSALAANFDGMIGLPGMVNAPLIVFAEFVCAALVIFGAATRLACIPLVFAMGVAAFIRHANDPWFMGAGASKEPALLFLTIFLAIFFAGPGRWSVDAYMRR